MLVARLWLPVCQLFILKNLVSIELAEKHAAAQRLAEDKERVERERREIEEQRKKAEEEARLLQEVTKDVNYALLAQCL